MPDSPLNVYLRLVKQLVDDAERELTRRQWRSFIATLRYLAEHKDREKVG